MPKSRNMITANFDINEVRNIKLGIKKLLNLKTPEIAKKVSMMTFEAVEALGNVPIDTGKLETQGHGGIKDKYKKNTFIMGWTTPYAKFVYFGIHHEAVWRTIDGKKKKFYISNSGQPFWDFPVTRNNGVMIGIYEKALKTIKELN